MVNPLGAIVVFDGEVPRTFTAIAADNISGGQLVVCNGTANTVGSSIATYVVGDITATPVVDSSACNGIALQNASSGTLVAIAQRGSYLVRCGGVCSGGVQVIAGSATLPFVAPLGAVGSPNYALNGTPIGRTQTPSASGTSLYTLVSLNL